MSVSYWQITAVAVGGLVLFVGGYQYAAALYSEDIAALRADYAEHTQALEREYREKEKAATAALSAAWTERDKALADAIDLRADAERVRSEASAAKRKLSRASSGTCKPEREKLARCVDLLSEGVGLLAEGTELSQRVAIDKDALAALKQ